MEYAELNNGLKMPVEGIGTFLLSPAEAEESVYQALKAGAFSRRDGGDRGTEYAFEL